MSYRLALVLILALTGCATIVQGPMQRVAFETQPSGATVRAQAQTCTTPCSLRLKRNHNVVARITKDGYADADVLLQYELDPWILGNLAFLPFFAVGGIVDIVSGSGFQLYPPVVQFPLAPEHQETRPAPGQEGAAPQPEKKTPSPPPRTTPDGDEWKPIPESRDM